MSNTQATELQELLGIPAEMEVNGRKVRLHPLTLGDMALCDQDILSRRKLNPIKEAAEACKGLPEDDPTRAAIIERGFTFSKEYEEVSEEDRARYMTSLPGLMFRVYLSLRKDYPDITRDESDEISKVIFEENIQIVTQKFLDMCEALTPEQARNLAMYGEAKLPRERMSGEFDGMPTPDPTSDTSSDDTS